MSICPKIYGRCSQTKQAYDYYMSKDKCIPNHWRYANRPWYCCQMPSIKRYAYGQVTPNRLNVCAEVKGDMV